MRRARGVLELLAPIVLVVLVALFGTTVSSSTQTYVVTTLVNVAIVVALYIFIGNSGVVSFGHISFVAIGAWTAGVLATPATEKPAVMPELFGFLRDTTVGNVPSLALAAAVAVVVIAASYAPARRASRIAPADALRNS